ncbi:MAG: hypothetical protein DK306_000642 [Chloroflexi bacterium]|jgi:hypothetical protein|nr:MAG: hypothetical protein DK306_000642 [Chloroflexota bacterium]
MLIARLQARFGVRAVLLGLLMLGLVFATWSVGADSASAASSAGVSDTPVIERADDESDDPFHVSDASLAVAFFIPGIFLLATGATVAWAISARNRGDEEDDDA